MRKINERTIEKVLGMYMSGTIFVINNGKIKEIKNPIADQSTQG